MGVMEIVPPVVEIVADEVSGDVIVKAPTAEFIEMAEAPEAVMLASAPSVTDWLLMIRLPPP